VANLERRLALLEGREAGLTSQLRSAEAAAAEADILAADNASLREQLRELQRQRGHLEHHKSVSASLCVCVLWLVARGSVWGMWMQWNQS
jgi:hypothetical protein